jgi:hypothetical protein
MAATYRKFGNPTTRGRPIPVDETERVTLLGLELIAVDIPPYIEPHLHAVPVDPLLNQEITRIIQNILGSVARAGTERGGVYPDRYSLNFSDLFRLFNELWRRQRGNCNLCKGPIVPGEENPLLKMSADRIDSANKIYDGENAHLTHVGCNLAKSSASIEEWREFLDVLRAEEQDGP